MSAPFCETLWFSALARFLSIQTDHPEVSRYLKNAFSRAALTPKTQSDDCDTGAIFCAGSTQYVTFNDEPVNFANPEALATPFRAAFYGSSKLFRLSFRLSPGWHSLYGAALRINDRAVIIASHSGTGKTTLTLELLSRGAQLYSDEYVFVRKSDREVSGLARTLMVRERTLSLVGNDRLRAVCSSLPSRQPARGGRVWDFVDAGNVFGKDVFAKPAPLSYVVILKRSDAGVAKAEPIASSIAAADLLPHFNAGGTGFNRLAEIAGTLSGIPCYRLTTGPPARTADALLKLVDK